MKTQLFAVYDSKAEIYEKPFHMQTVGQALRGFTDVINDKETPLGQHPEDYTLFHIGDYDNTTANFNIYESKKSLGNGIEFLETLDILKEQTA